MFVNVDHWRLLFVLVIDTSEQFSDALLVLIGVINIVGKSVIGFRGNSSRKNTDFTPVIVVIWLVLKS